MDQTLEAALEAARRAVDFDKKEQYQQAIYYYGVTLNLVKFFSTFPVLVKKCKEYEERMLELQIMILDEERKKYQLVAPVRTELQRCKFLLSLALDADEAGFKKEAIKLYTDAAEIGLQAKTIEVDKMKITNLVRHALDRAESLKGFDKNQINIVSPALLSVSDANISKDDGVKIKFTSTSKSSRHVCDRSDNAHLKVTGGSVNYSEEEKRVLMNGSQINDHEFVPFMNVDLLEKFQYTIPFTDKDGLLELSPKQKPDFTRWCRPEELFSKPRMVMGLAVDYHSIKQTVVSDCSFVASLAVSAQYESKFGRRLITSIIYPKNKNKEPIYNPFGKYMIKLYINGVARKVVIDDLLPVNCYNQLLCSYSNNRGELWISLLEKAYMKIMGGYDFPGSNSNIDLHALTQWIPERQAIRLNDQDFNKDNLFNILLLHLHKGDILVTVATGDFSDAEADRTGLVPTHAYAVLDVRKVNGIKLLQLKNPWSHLRWRGNYSEMDIKNWTYSLKQTLNYNPDSASQFDNGIFWIDFESICHFFDVFYINWNPGLFDYTYCIHQKWTVGTSPMRDAYNISENPQFCLEVNPDLTGTIWILLTRHITNIADFRQNEEYITVLVYRNDGKRVYYPHDPPPYIDGVRINSPHYLCKIRLDQNHDERYTLVISQYEKTNTIYYTLRAYGTLSFTLHKIAEPYKFEKEITNGQWKSTSAGGCGNHPATYNFNPRYQLILESSRNKNWLLIILKGPKQYQIGFEIISVILNGLGNSLDFKKRSSGPFRSGFVYMEMDDVPAGIYHIIPSTFLPGQEGPFFLTIKSSCVLHLNQIQ